MEIAITKSGEKVVTKSLILDVLALAFVFFTPTLSHLVG